MQTSTSNVVSMVEIDFSFDEFSNSFDVVAGDRSEELFSFLDVDLLAPLADVDGVETTGHSLTAGVFFDESGLSMSEGGKKDTVDGIVLDSSYDVLVLLLDHELSFVVVDWLGTVLKNSVRTCFRRQVKDPSVPHSNPPGTLPWSQRKLDDDAAFVPCSWG